MHGLFGLPEPHLVDSIQVPQLHPREVQRVHEEPEVGGVDQFGWVTGCVLRLSTSSSWARSNSSRRIRLYSEMQPKTLGCGYGLNLLPKSAASCFSLLTSEVVSFSYLKSLGPLPDYYWAGTSPYFLNMVPELSYIILLALPSPDRLSAR